MEQLRERFLKVYANLPLPMRDETILLLADRLKDASVKMPITWNVIYLEVYRDTEVGKKFLKELADLELI